MKELLKTIFTSDAMLDMPLKSQILYLHCLFSADSEGYLINFNSIKRYIGCSDAETRILFECDYLIDEDGAIKVDVYDTKIGKAVFGDGK